MCKLLYGFLKEMYNLFITCITYTCLLIKEQKAELHHSWLIYFLLLWCYDLSHFDWLLVPLSRVWWRLTYLSRCMSAIFQSFVTQHLWHITECEFVLQRCQSNYHGIIIIAIIRKNPSKEYWGRVYRVHQKSAYKHLHLYGVHEFGFFFLLLTFSEMT